MKCCSEMMKRHHVPASKPTKGLASASRQPSEGTTRRRPRDNEQPTVLTPEGLSLKYANVLKSQTLGFKNTSELRAATVVKPDPQPEFVTATPLPSISQDVSLKLQLQEYMLAHERKLDSTSPLHASGSQGPMAAALPLKSVERSLATAASRYTISTRTPSGTVTPQTTSTSETTMPLRVSPQRDQDITSSLMKKQPGKSSGLVPRDNLQRYELMYGDDDPVTIAVVGRSNGRQHGSKVPDEDDGETLALKFAPEERAARDSSFVSGLAARAQQSRSGLLSSIAEAFQMCATSFGLGRSRVQGASPAAGASLSFSARYDQVDSDPSASTSIRPSSNSSTSSENKPGHAGRAQWSSQMKAYSLETTTYTPSDKANNKPNIDPVKLSWLLPLPPPPAPAPPLYLQRRSSALPPQRSLQLSPRQVPSMSFPKWRQVEPGKKKALFKIRSPDYKLESMKGYTSRYRLMISGSLIRYQDTISTQHTICHYLS